MKDLKLFDAEYKFMDIIWELEPINSTELTRICEKKLGWKKSTTYHDKKAVQSWNIKKRKCYSHHLSKA